VRSSGPAIEPETGNQDDVHSLTLSAATDRTPGRYLAEGGAQRTGRAAFRERAIPSPVRVTRDPQRLSDDRRYDVPITVIACEFPSAMLREWIAEGHPYVQELAKVRDVGYVDLPTGHWPQFTRPQELGRAILASAGPA
jgi:pimeloyl-ACP methyl ester carboxylesterase